MAEIILVRHGQANSAATDEASYDRLSELGHRQAAWLGAHIRATNGHFDHVVAGDMLRQQETARGMGYAPDIDARWNELSYFGLSAALERLTGITHPEPGEAFVKHAGIVFDHWQRDVLPDPPEAYAAFEGRILAALADVAGRGGRSLVVTSAGVIGALMRHVLDLPVQAQVKMIVQTANSSMHRIEVLRGEPFVAEFNATPHLDAPDRRQYRTFY